MQNSSIAFDGVTRAVGTGSGPTGPATPERVCRYWLALAQLAELPVVVKNSLQQYCADLVRFTPESGSDAVVEERGLVPEAVIGPKRLIDYRNVARSPEADIPVWLSVASG
jgi:hypothetical protein